MDLFVEIANLLTKFVVSELKFFVFLQKILVSVDFIQNFVFCVFDLMLRFVELLCANFLFVPELVDHLFEALILFHIIG